MQNKYAIAKNIGKSSKQVRKTLQEKKRRKLGRGTSNEVHRKKAEFRVVMASHWPSLLLREEKHLPPAGVVEILVGNAR